METTQKQRVEIELDELNTKINSLDNFKNNKTAFSKLPKAQQELLQQQYFVMENYKKILEKRLSIWVD